MGSPTTEIFFVFNISTGAVLTGAAAGMSFDTYKDETGSNLSQPLISEIGGGAYGFTPVFASPSHGIVYVLNTGTSGNPQKLSRYIRPEDYAADNISTVLTAVQQIQAFSEGKWKIFTTGPDANRLVVYDTDGTTVLKKYDLVDRNGIATYINPFARLPV